MKIRPDDVYNVRSERPNLHYTISQEDTHNSFWLTLAILKIADKVYMFSNFDHPDFGIPFEKRGGWLGG